VWKFCGSFFRFISLYKTLLTTKREEIGSQVTKLRNGLFKIDDTREKVEKMSIELEDAKVKVAAFQKQCDEYLVTLVQQKKQADEQQKQVSATSEKIAQEEIKCKASVVKNKLNRFDSEFRFRVSIPSLDFEFRFRV